MKELLIVCALAVLLLVAVQHDNRERAKRCHALLVNASTHDTLLVYQAAPECAQP